MDPFLLTAYVVLGAVATALLAFGCCYLCTLRSRSPVPPDSRGGYAPVSTKDEDAWGESLNSGPLPRGGSVCARVCACCGTASRGRARDGVAATWRGGAGRGGGDSASGGGGSAEGPADISAMEQGDQRLAATFAANFCKNSGLFIWG
jgi:hypothetical protein